MLQQYVIILKSNKKSDNEKTNDSEKGCVVIYEIYSNEKPSS